METPGLDRRTKGFAMAAEGLSGPVLATRLREAACDVRSAGVGIPGYGAATWDAAAELDRVAAEVETVDVEQDRTRSRTTVRRLMVAAVLLVEVYFATAFAAYQIGVGRHVESSTTVEVGNQAVPTVVPHNPAAEIRGARKHVCATLARSYPSMSAPLRAHHSPPTVVLSPQDYPNRTLHGEATDLAEILESDLAPAYVQQTPWPAWVQAFDNYVAALRAVSFVETNPTAPQVRAGIMDLYQQALVEPMQLCHIPE